MSFKISARLLASRDCDLLVGRCPVCHDAGMRWFRRHRSAPEVAVAKPPVEPVGEGPLTPELLAEAAARCLSPEAQALVRSLAQPSLRLSPTTDRSVAAGRLGGAAMLPPQAEWPTWQGRGLEVVAVLDLMKLPRLAGLPLPRTGWLTFFYDATEQSAWGFDPTQRDAWRVVYSVDAQPRPAPGGTETLPEVALAAVEELTAPDPFEDVLKGLHQTERDGLFAFGDALPPVSEPAHRIGGWPGLVQNSMWLGVQLASNGIYVGGPEGYTDSRVPDLAQGAGDWRLLLQIDSDDDASMMWGDVGRLYFLIREDDLESSAFDRCWFELQCS